MYNSSQMNGWLTDYLSNLMSDFYFLYFLLEGTNVTVYAMQMIIVTMNLVWAEKNQLFIW
jgi:hypothetical protein